MSQPSDLEFEDLSQSPQQPQPPGYEFTMAQNDIIRVLSQKMKFVGFFYVFAGGLMGLVSLIALLMMPWVGLFYLLLLAPQLLIGIWNINAANSFGLVVNTKGQDIPHLMSALVSLRKLYTLMFWVLVLALSLVVIGIAAGIFLWSTGELPFPTGTTAYISMLC